MPSRISGACNGCRTKKQKCSGDRNGCAQCVAASIVCTWPEQRKRGPAKGYIEGLEHRLHEAESLLLQLLPVVTPDQLSTATTTLTTAGMRDSPEHMSGRASPPALNKKTGIEYWETFPLDTVENIRRWQGDCAMHSQFRDDAPGSGHAHSRANSIDVQRETAPNVRKQSNLSHFRSMSTDSYAGRSPHASSTPTSQPEYMTSQVPQQPQQQQQWSSGYMQTGYNSSDQQHWQQQNQYQQQNQVQMEVDSGFFPTDMKRNLFW